MPPDFPSLSFFLVISIGQDIISASTEYDKCVDKNADVYEKAEFYKGDQSCFFIPRRATDLANTQNNVSGNFVFDMAVARNICVEHDGTLPIVFNSFENEFLIKFASQYGMVALGMQTTKYGERRWDDGMLLDYLPGGLVQRVGRDDMDYFTILMPKAAHPEWQFIASGTELPQPVQVICEQPHSPSYIPIDKCLSPTNQQYVATKIIKHGGSHVCYFIVHNATQGANKKRPNGKCAFNIEYARSICMANGGIMPIIHTNKTYTNMIAFHKAHFEGMKRMALGLQHDPDIYWLSWDDTSDLAFTPHPLPNMESSPKKRNFFALVDEAKYTWMDEEDGAETSDMSSVICQQGHEMQIMMSAGDPNLYKKEMASTTGAQMSIHNMKMVFIFMCLWTLGIYWAVLITLGY